jgi:hypothetical protein
MFFYLKGLAAAVNDNTILNRDRKVFSVADRREALKMKRIEIENLKWEEKGCCMLHVKLTL